MSTKKANHTHKYQLVRLKNNNDIFKCCIPGCPHYMPQKELTLGRMTVCNGNCGTEFAMERDHLSKKRPMCKDCIEMKLRRLDALAAVGRSSEAEDD